VRRDMGAHHLCPAPDGLQDCVTDRMMDIATACPLLLFPNAQNVLSYYVELV